MKFKPLPILSALVLVLSAGCAQSGPMPAPPQAKTMTLGAFQLVSLRDALYVAPNDGQTFGLNVAPGDVAKVLATAHAPTDKITLSVDALLVKAPGRLMLFDTGLGPAVHGVLVASLAQAGVKPVDITDVIITHSHSDHVGGLLDKGALAFPNATVHMSVREWSFMQGPGGANAIARVIAPRVKTFEPGAVVAPGVTSKAIIGHTPGHVGYEIVSGQSRLLDIGDAAHSSIISLARPDWSVEFDGDHAAANASRVALLRRLADSHELVFAPHFPFPGIGRIVKAGSAYAWAPQE
jgi:glyoxylase-like metal-dependent hydrolase (beta-lactamase superfamily II)